jgi:hypothetical protein
MNGEENIAEVLSDILALTDQLQCLRSRERFARDAEVLRPLGEILIAYLQTATAPLAPFPCCI